MKYVKFEMSAGCCGTDKTVYARFDDNVSDDEIIDCGEDMAWEHAESYGAIEEWEQDNPEIEFELDYGYEFIKEEDKPDYEEWEDL